MIFSKLKHISTLFNTTLLIRRFTNAPFKPAKTRKMPKDKNLIHELQKQRTRQKAQAARYSPSKIELQVIGNGGRGEPRALIIATDHTNYLFNCGEGTQRLSHEHRVRLTKVEHVFITRPVWDNMGGILGLALTVQDSGIPQINLHGPDGTIDLFEATQKFVILESLQVVGADTSKKFIDHTMEVDYILLQNPKELENIDDEQNNEIVDDTNYYSYHTNVYGKRLKLTRPGSTLTPTSSLRINSIMAFACKIHPKPGALDIKKCIQHGVPAGPCLGQLKAGKDVTLPDGRVIMSSDVVSESEDGPLIIVLECPNEDWLEIIENSNDFDKFQQSEITEKFDKYIVHFTPKNILNNTRYQKWMEKFGTNTQHLIVNEENTGFTSEAIHKMQHQLHLIHPEIFPFLEEQNTIEQKNNHEKKENDVNAVSSNNKDKILKLHQCQTLNTVHLRPHNGLNTSISVSIHPEEYVRTVFGIEGFLDCLAELQTDLNAKTKSLIGMEEYPKLLMLGTGSSIPNKTRNTSGILLQISEDKSILLDCGEGSVGQLIRFFGCSKVEKILKSIKAIYISHLHADHHLGFIGILKERAKVTDEPLFLLAPHQILAWLQYYDKRFERISHYYKLFSNRDFISGYGVLSSATTKTLYENLNVKNIGTTYVKHCPFAYGVAITLNNGKKIVYSGDTIPCESLVNLGKGCDLLIHEATMEDELENEAKIKSHSTISQAINVGVDMDAKFTMLTHFSQRYSKLPVIPDEKSNIDFTKVGIAYDFMHISLSHLTLLPLFYPSLKVLFSEFIAYLDHKAKLRDMKRERQLKSNSNLS